MKRQFLGDAKDAFKWDYLDFLTRELGIQFLNILLMLTPDKNNRDGKMPPDGFPASQEILEFCKKLQKVQGGSDSNILNLLRDLPKCTNADYAVKLHKECEDFAALHTKGTRGNYFTGISSDQSQVIFLDPDNGFAPLNSRAQNSHVKHGEVKHILKHSHPDSVVVVYQDLIRKSQKTFWAETQGKFSPDHTPAVYWSNRAMLFALGKSAEQVDKVREIRKYQKFLRPVQVLD